MSRSLTETTQENEGSAPGRSPFSIPFLTPAAIGNAGYASAAPARDKMSAMVRLDGVDKSYNGRTYILTDVSLTIREGERVALIGSNGCGKTTLLKSLIGLHPISGGRIETMGESFSRRPTGEQMRRLRRRSGFVFQRHCLVLRRTVLSNVVHGMLGAPGSWRGFCQSTALEEWRERAMDALRDVNLEHKAMERADSLSGGQQQRVAIARALIRRPKLLIADEPSASLDPASGREVMELFSTLCRQHAITLVFTSHDMKHATAFSDRIVALKNGRIHFDAPSARVDAALTESVFA